MRDERGLDQNDNGSTFDSFSFSGRFIIPNAKDQLTFEFAGRSHTGSTSNRDGYKVEFDETGKGVYLQKQKETHYGVQSPAQNNIQVKTGQVLDIQITKQNIGSESAPTGVDITCSVNGSQIGYIEDKTSRSSTNDFFYDDPDMPIIVPPWSLAHSIHALRPLLVWCEFASARSSLEDISSFIISS
jgi:hypothetical protein